jgi:hypothetical protein
MSNNIGEIPIDRKFFEPIVRQLHDLKIVAAKKRVATFARKKESESARQLVTNSMDQDIVLLISIDDITNAYCDDELFAKFQDSFN